MRAFRALAAASLLLTLAACDGLLTGIDSSDPTDLSYSITGGESPGSPYGVLLTWEPPRAREAWTYAVYGRTSTYGEWYLVGVTTSPTFHDAGPQQRQYHVAARDEDDYEFGRSRTVTIEVATALAMPEGLTSASLDGAVQLGWSDNAQQAAPSRFSHYRVYMAAVTATGGCGVTGWQLAGTTASPVFLVSGLANGVTRCFAVSAVSREGVESSFSRSRSDTPRYDARHVRIDAFDARPATSGFQFHDPAAARFGVVVEGTSSQADFRVERAADGSFRLHATRDAVRMAVFGATPVADLSAVDVAPASGYTLGEVSVQPGMAYVFRIARSDGVRYGVVRIAYVTADYVVCDWAYQPAADNPELQVNPAT